MKQEPINDDVLRVCGQHWDRTDRGCAHCPIRAVCHDSPTGLLSAERLQEWRTRLNSAAAAELRRAAG